MKRLLITVIAILMLTMLVACGNKSESVNNDTSATDIVYSCTQPEYFYDKYSVTMSNFMAKVNEVSNEADDVLSNFCENPIVTEDFLLKMAELNRGYDVVEDLYYSVRFGSVEDVSVKEFLNMEYYIKGGWFNEPMLEIPYDEIYQDSNSTADYINGNWYHSYSFRYANGIFEISEGNYIIVEWSENLATDNAECGEYRKFTVTDNNKDAYLLLHGEAGWQLVRIMAV